ncbi:oxidoreductase [Pedobacter ginsengisoli]|uniref:Oxidoreductase n=1 Tax=Pedobacter ginsengisoli TaxID=363852 RepID=A0A2D1U2A7_9SPHI|nr:SDR family oxidoreductase [Pedobacter ginsengisoli]ATP55750.1 oxidoreductase [Pedobacter ginsengisoli]
MALEINLKGRVALITGVTSGIGLGVAKILAEAGCIVAGCAEYSEESPQAKVFLETVGAIGERVSYVKADMRNPEEIRTFVETIAEREGGKINILVSNAGKNVFDRPEGCSEMDWDFNMNLNLASHWRITKFSKPYLEKNNGVIIVISSNHAYSTLPGCFPYNITKTALTGLVRSLAIEWGPKIRTVGIAPGFIDTPGNQLWFDSFLDPALEKQKTIELHPVKNLGTPEEIGGWCAFLASEYAAFASGTTYLVDGGRNALMQDA